MKHVANRVGFMLESPQDPKSYLQNGEGDESASFWAWEETRDFLETFQSSGMELISFDQGAFGHIRKKHNMSLVNENDIWRSTWMKGCIKLPLGLFGHRG